MPVKNTSVTVTYHAINASTGLPVPGDVANHTIRGIGDGTEYTPAASPAEVDATNAPGVYKIVIASGENNVDINEIAGKSSTLPVVLIGMSWANTVPVAVPINFTALDIETDGTIHTNIDSQVLSTSAVSGLVTSIFQKDVVAMGLTGNEAGAILANIGDANDFLSAVPTGYSAGTVADLINKLNFSGNAASSAEVLALSNNTSTRLSIPEFFARPASGSTTYILGLYVYDDVGNMETPDSTPTLVVINESGTSRAANLGTITPIGTGHYEVTYTVSSAHAIEQLRFEWTIVEGGLTRIAGQSVLVSDTTAVDFTVTDRTTLNGIASTVSTNLNATVSSRSTYAGGPVASVTAPVTVAGGSGGATVEEIVAGILAETFDAALHTRDQSGITDPTVADALYGSWVVAFGADDAAVRTFNRRGATDQIVRAFALAANVNSQSRT